MTAAAPTKATPEVQTPAEDGTTPAAGDQVLDESAVSEKEEKTPENGEKIIEEETVENKKSKEKTKKKKWSFRSISFSRKDKSKPAKETEKNGDVKEVVEEVSDFLFGETRALKLFRKPLNLVGFYLSFYGFIMVVFFIICSWFHGLLVPSSIYGMAIIVPSTLI